MSSRYVFLGDALVSWKTKKQKTVAIWKTKKQKTVAKSSAEVEYRAMFATTSELEWTAHLLQDLFLPLYLPVMMHCDNNAA